MYKLFVHAGSSNHGCEAIVRTTVNIIGQPTILYSRKPELDSKYGIDDICELQYDERRNISKRSIAWFISALQIKLFGKIDLAMKYQYKNLIDNV